MGVGDLEAVQEEEWAAPSHALLTRPTGGVVFMREKLRRQSKISLGWKTRFRDENRLVIKLKKEKDAYLETVHSQLLIFESSLKKGRKELEAVIAHKDDIIRRQHHLICSLTLALIKNEGHKDLQQILPGLSLHRTPSTISKTSNNNDSSDKDYETVSTNNILNEQHSQFNNEKKQTGVISTSKSDFESLNDSDSAIMMEDAYDSLIALPVGKGEVKVMRSVSDALEIISRGVSSSLNHNKPSPAACPSRRPHGSLSSTPSCSSSESDESPTSTISKSRADLLDLNEDNADILRHLNSSTNSNLPLSSSTPNNTYEPIINTGNVWEMSGFMCPKEEEDPCDRALCSSPCFHCSSSSSSTTPLVSPSQTPSISPSTTPPTYPKRFSGDSLSKTKYDFDSDATLSDGQSDDGESEHLGCRTHHLTANREEDVADQTASRFGSYEKLNHFDVSYLKTIRTPKSETIQVTYNRVMSNHRSVTKPKDVKYKRINKAKSRSLEELRGKLKLYDGKQAHSVDHGHGQSDA